MKHYRLAKETKYNLIPFGPFMTLAKARAYQADMERRGKQVLILNCAPTEKPQGKTRQQKVTETLRRHGLLTV